jgi:hypothetical protein
VYSGFSGPDLLLTAYRSLLSVHFIPPSLIDTARAFLFQKSGIPGTQESDSNILIENPLSVNCRFRAEEISDPFSSFSLVWNT